MTIGLRGRILAAVLLLAAFCCPAWAQDGAAALKAADDALESQPIGGHRATSDNAKSAASPVAPGAFDVTRVLLATVGVIVLILLMRVGIRKIFPSAVSHRATSAVKVLSRCTISPRQRLLVVQFGKRLVLVGDSGSSLNPLCEIADADEAATIVAQTREESISVARRFDSLFGRARKDFDPPTEAEQREAFDNTDEIPPEAVPPGEDSSLQETQKELADLHEKVRDVARRLGRG